MYVLVRIRQTRGSSFFSFFFFGPLLVLLSLSFPRIGKWGYTYRQIVYSCCEEYPALGKKKRELEIESSENDDRGRGYNVEMAWLR